MTTKRGKAVREQRVSLGADLRIGHAREIFDALAAATDKATVVIDASAVSKVDAAGLQAITAFLVRWRISGKAWRWDNATDTLRASARSAGLDSALELE
jgi:anti-anti-sigma regulatory factor